LFEKETRNTASRVSTLEQDYQAKYDLTQYGNSLGYTQFHIVETKETAFADLSQRLEQMKCLNTLMNTNITQY
jgi:DNA invertase Pin-like site-specific DNA recombinase